MSAYIGIMQQIDFAHLTYLVILGSVLVLWFVVQNRDSVGKLMQQALM